VGLFGLVGFVVVVGVWGFGDWWFSGGVVCFWCGFWGFGGVGVGLWGWPQFRVLLGTTKKDFGIPGGRKYYFDCQGLSETGLTD